MKFTFLGTSSGVPTLERNVTGLALQKANSKTWYLVDCGEATQQQLHKASLSLCHLEAIFITHVHGDHCYGLPGLLASASMAGRKKPLRIIAPPEIKEFVTTTMRLTDAYMSYELSFSHSDALANEQFNNDFLVSSIALSHRVPCHAFVFEESDSKTKLDIEKLHRIGLPQGPLWGELAKGRKVSWPPGKTLDPKDVALSKDKNRKVIVGGDNDTPECLRVAARGADVLIHEATYTEAVKQKVGPGPQHSSAAEVAHFAQSANIPNLVLTHFSARYHYGSANQRSPISELENEAKNHFNNRLFLAKDLDTFLLDKDGSLSLTAR